jgi:ribosome biogenesis GTPase
LINAYGWSDALGQVFTPYAAQGFEPGRVIVQQRGLYAVATDSGDIECRLSGRFLREAVEGGHPAVGDWVALTVRPGEGAGTIHSVLPRRSAFTRKAADSVQTVQVVAANVDIAFLVVAMNGDLNARRLERYLASAWQSGARPVVVLTKSDLTRDPQAAMADAEAAAFGVPVIAVSVVTGEGIDGLRDHLKPGETAVLVGPSGVGKSTLVNALNGEVVMATGATRADDARGRHTTTHRELILLPSGAMVLDTPGMRELGLLDAQDGVETTFEDVKSLAATCRFRDCGHTNEPGCAIRAALEGGALDPGRWKNYRKLTRELAFVERKEDRAAREAERKRWISIAKAQRAGKKVKDRW